MNQQLFIITKREGGITRYLGKRSGFITDRKLAREMESITAIRELRKTDDTDARIEKVKRVQSN